jgi:hypothetical protein
MRNNAKCIMYLCLPPITYALPIVSHLSLMHYPSYLRPTYRDSNRTEELSVESAAEPPNRSPAGTITVATLRASTASRRCQHARGRYLPPSRSSQHRSIDRSQHRSIDCDVRTLSSSQILSQSFSLAETISGLQHSQSNQ